MPRRGQPHPEPTDAICSRLEDIRALSGLDLKSFWGRLRDEAGLELSYAAARHYHFDRTPPVEYLVAVSQVYQRSLEWLATGEGDPTDIQTPDELEAARQERHERVRAALMRGFGHRRMSEAAISELVKVWAKAHLCRGLGSLTDYDLERAQDDLAQEVGNLAGSVLQLFDVEPASLSTADTADFIPMLVPAFAWAERIRWTRAAMDVAKEEADGEA